MYATDAVVVVARQEATAERTTRQTALSFTREPNHNHKQHPPATAWFQGMLQFQPMDGWV